MNKKQFLTAEERETIISWADDDNDEIFIYTSQQPMIRRLLKNPLFRCEDKRYNKSYHYYPNPISVEGHLPRKCLTLRTKIVKRELTDQQRKELADRLRYSLKR